MARYDDGGRAPGAGLAPGRRTLTQGLRAPRAPAPEPSRPAEAARGGGKLPYAAELGHAFGYSLDHVKARTSVADELAPYGAEAMTVGGEVAFADEKPSPALVAHEATHVIQNEQAGASAAMAAGIVAPRDSEAEAEAHDIARIVRTNGFASSLPPVTAAPAAQVHLSPDQQSADAEPTEEVELTIEWRGQFGADLSSDLTIQGSNKTKGGWVDITTTSVEDEDGAEGDKKQKMSTTVTVKRYKRYQVIFTPTASEPDDRYKRSEATVSVKDSDADAKLYKVLDVERWNTKNVQDRHREKDIDPDKADNISAVPLFGRSVRVNEVVKDRVANTNALYEALPAETKTEIGKSLFVTGGYAYRTTTQGEYSNHSVGYAIDVNYNLGTKQNFHFQENDMSLLTELVEPVVRLDPNFADFEIDKDKGERQLDASRIFNERFPLFLAELMGRDENSEALRGADAAIEAAHYMPFPVGNATAVALLFKEQHALDLFNSVSDSDLEAAIKEQKNATKKKQLKLIRANWSALRAWLFGAKVKDEAEDTTKEIKGMIPLRKDVLMMFLDTGWDWGGDWSDEKDYMHFEDREALAKVKYDKKDDDDGGTE